LQRIGRGNDRDESGLIDLGEFYSTVEAQVIDATKHPWLARNDLVREMSLFWLGAIGSRSG
jgi:hypothetical protein